MDEQTEFEARAVLSRKRTRWSRFAILVPALALVATAWAGLSGRSERNDAGASQAAAATSDTSPNAPPSLTAARPPKQQPPGEVLGLDVRALDEVDPDGFERDEVIALAGWYLATAITDCPPLAAVFRETNGPEAESYVDSWRFCERSGVLFASRPEFSGGQPANDFQENRSKNSGLPAINVSVDERVVMPAQLEVIGGEATAVVVLGRFVEPNDRCHWPLDCPHELVVDHIAWSGG